jgi:hypothetical protein
MNAADDRVRNQPFVVEQKIERYILVHLDQPKHVYVTLKSVKDGTVYERVYVSKHCNKWRDNEVGAEYNVKVNMVRDPRTQQTYPQFESLYATFCG